MKEARRIIRSLALVAVSLTTLLFGCEKETLPREITPAHVPVGLGLQTREESLKNRAWVKFLRQVEQGEINDPVGQYVSKGACLSQPGEGPRPTRPKYNAQNRQFQVDAAGEIVLNSAPPCGTNDSEYGGGGAASTVVFVSTEGVAPYSGADNPNGYIYDLKLVSGASEQLAPIGYAKLATDLNDQAGGGYIHLTFTRNPGQVKNGREYYQNKPLRNRTSDGN